MAEKYLFMSIILIGIITAKIAGYRTCQGRERECQRNRRPNCLEKNHQPYFQCSLMNEHCEVAWKLYCRRPYFLTCYDGYTYCDCVCVRPRRPRGVPR
uniref:Putative conserved secreted protein n=1 Tax=Rhipicephalus microplus TaxID=6941 RepID=A0A6G5A4J6_RHIMP